MIGKELCEFIKEHELEEFELEFCYGECPDFTSGKIVGVADVGYSDKVIILDAEVAK